MRLININEYCPNILVIKKLYDIIIIEYSIALIIIDSFKQTNY
jgi:hypothetical protein